VKKILLILFVFLIGVGIYVSQSDKLHPAPIVDATVSPQETISEIKNVQSFIPSKLIISKIGINTSIESVGLDGEKRMDVPKDDMNVGWYKYGAIPGEKGSAVLAGHFDTKSGGPAIFYRLSELKKGDSIIVTSKSKDERTFIVTEIQVFKNETFPISLVFSQDDTERLNLITCDGVFDNNEKNYTDRLVVFSELKKN
jgi:sortase A